MLRRSEKDRSAIYRRSFQGGFLLLNLWIGTRFYSLVRHFEVGLGPSEVTRPAAVEGWLPIAGLLNLKYWLLSGQIALVHPAAGIRVMFLGVAGFAKATGHWSSPHPGAVYQRLVPNADEAAHPMP